jgi:F-type H+-transporting ATPase subunit epsilon
VVGGFAEMGPGGLTVLADRAGSREDFDLQALADDIRDAEEDVADCTDDAQRDKLARRLDQMRSLQAALAQ